MLATTELMQYLPDGWENKCGEFKVIERKRGIRTPHDLMRLSLYHLVNGCSLMETSEIARLLEIGEFSDVAFMKKFAKCADWFGWISETLAGTMTAAYKKPAFLDGSRVLAFDATTVTEKGRSGRLYRLHYCVDVFSLGSVAHKATGQDVGESLLNFTLASGDLAIADRAYTTLKGVKHCMDSGAQYILRYRSNSFNLYDEGGAKIDVPLFLQGIGHGQTKSMEAFIHPSGGGAARVRVCVKRKDSDVCAASLRKQAQKASKRCRKAGDAAKLFCEFVIVVTSLPESVCADDVLDAYRCRWQIECFFKRLKSILDLGELPKKSVASSMAWINGKTLVALLIEKLVGEGLFPPQDFCQSDEERLARDEIRQPIA